jgi:hypothetical protein
VLKDALKEDDDWADISDKYDAIALFGLIEKCVLKQTSNKYPYLILQEEWRSLLLCKQESDHTTNAYYERMSNRVTILERAGGIFHTPELLDIETELLYPTQQYDAITPDEQQKVRAVVKEKYLATLFLDAFALDPVTDAAALVDFVRGHVTQLVARGAQERLVAFAHATQVGRIGLEGVEDSVALACVEAAFDPAQQSAAQVAAMAKRQIIARMDVHAIAVAVGETINDVMWDLILTMDLYVPVEPWDVRYAVEDATMAARAARAVRKYWDAFSAHGMSLVFEEDPHIGFDGQPIPCDILHKPSGMFLSDIEDTWTEHHMPMAFKMTTLLFDTSEVMWRCIGPHPEAWASTFAACASMVHY